MNRRFLRSVNLERDGASEAGLAGYVVTPCVRQALAHIGSAFTSGIKERAFTVTGPYGTGKSSFALFLRRLLAEKTDDAWELLSRVDAELEASLRAMVFGRKNTKGVLPLPVTAREAHVSELLAEAFDNAGKDVAKTVQKELDCLRTSRDTKQSIRLVCAAMKKLTQPGGYDGVCFIVDELGKVFDAARRGVNVDVFLLQELAEAASRSADAPIVFVGLIHQSFADYASGEQVLQNEFRKIEGRFEPISFSEPVGSQIHLAAMAFPEQKLNGASVRRCSSVAAACKDLSVGALVGLPEEDFNAYARRAYPLHPLVLAALPFLFRRFGQNERSIFTFLTSDECRGLQDFMRSCPDGSESLFTLANLYDYFFENYEAQLDKRLLAQPFLEAHETILAKSQTLSTTEKDVLKIIAVLTSLGLHCPIHATRDTINAAFAPGTLSGELDNLVKQSILVYRRFNKTYAFWGGSDVDFQDCCNRADKELAKSSFSMAETFRKFLPPKPIVAKRHTVEKGSLRYFDMVYADDPDDLAVIAHKENGGASGKFVVCLSDSKAHQRQFLEQAKTLSLENKDCIFAVPSRIDDLADALREVRRLTWIEANIPELRSDRVARRELAIRLASASVEVARHQSGVIDPRRSGAFSGCRYLVDGSERTVGNMREVSSMLSDVCDSLYREAPVIKNELVNKRAPSSQAAGARRIVINSLNSPEAVEKDRLGIEGYPPERSIYESIIALSGIHVKTRDGYKIQAPSPKSPTNLAPVWRKLEELVFSASDEPVNVKTIYSELIKPPYGVLDGVLPILLCAFYAVNKDEVSLYSEGTFLPDPQEAHFELLVRRPDLFAISGMHVTGVRKAVVERLSGGLGTATKVMPVVRRLYTMMNSLSKYARETNSVSEQTQKFRQAFFDAKSPERLLFVSLPTAFGLPPLDVGKRNDDLYNRFFIGLNKSLHELGSALPKLIDNCRRKLLSNCGFEESKEGWKALYDKASFLLARIGGSEICPFLQNVINTAGDWEKADQVVSFIQQTPVAKWSTMHIADFERNARGIGERFRIALRPYRSASENLSSVDRKRAEELSVKVSSVFGKAKPEVIRAALLACLSEMEEGGCDNGR